MSQAYSPFNRQRRGTAPPRTVPPPTDLGLPNATFLDNLTGAYRYSITDTPIASSDDEAIDYGTYLPATRRFVHNRADEDEQEAVRERDHSRREAERILREEAEDRRRTEEQHRLAHQERTRPRRSTIDVPAGVDGTSKGGWWSAAKQRLTPTKHLSMSEDVSGPSHSHRQQQQGQQGQLIPERHIQDPNSPRLLPLPQTPPRVPSSSQTAIKISPSPASQKNNHSQANNVNTKAPAESLPPHPESSSVYAQYNPYDGALDVSATLLTIAARFEKLERWSVNHVRALEERMKDVERYLVDRESRPPPGGTGAGPDDDIKKQVAHLRNAVHAVEASIADTRSTLPAAILSHLLPKGGESTEPFSYSASASTPSTAFHSAVASPSAAPYPALPFDIAGRASPPASAEDREKIHELNDTVKAKSHTTSGGPKPLPTQFAPRSRLPYPSGDYYELATSNNDSTPAGVSPSYGASGEPWTPPRPHQQQVSSSGSPILPIPRAVSPLALEPLVFEGDRQKANESIYDTRRYDDTGAHNDINRSASPIMMQSRAAQSASSLTLPPPITPSRARSSSSPSPAATPSPFRGPLAATVISVSPSMTASPSPTPRKRYTVALSGRASGLSRSPSPIPAAMRNKIQQDSDLSSTEDDETEEETDDQMASKDDDDVSIGHTPIALNRIVSPPTARSLSPLPKLTTPPSPESPNSQSSSPSPPRARTQSYILPPPTSFGALSLGKDLGSNTSLNSGRSLGGATLLNGSISSLTSSASTRSGNTQSSYHTSNSLTRSPPTGTPSRARAQSAQSSTNGSPTNSDISQESREADVFARRGVSTGFIDPLVLRKKEVERRSIEIRAATKAVADVATRPRVVGKKPPVNELVAFFTAVQD